MRLLFIILLAGKICFCFGQTTWEWTLQKKTQIKYLLNQIAANKVYIDYLEKGYSVARSGLQTIQDIKKADFNLHLDFFNSLKNVNPKIKNWVKVADIIAYQLRILKSTRQTIQDIKDTRQFTDNELDYCKGVFDNLLSECLNNIDELLTVITDGNLGMKDDERMKRIDQLYSDMQNKYSFASSFSEETGVLSAQRLAEQAEINMSKKLNGIR